ncbi:hypothetical protein MTYP_00505 [Methylophilaceae bacterium]|nr:hypothetical protein MTYP_00505 [Methylophilaceae bacterium]
MIKDRRFRIFFIPTSIGSKTIRNRFYSADVTVGFEGDFLSVERKGVYPC